MVNASQHPGPALWQGLMLILTDACFIALYSGDKPPSDRAVRYTIISLSIVGIVLIPVIHVLTKAAP